MSTTRRTGSSNIGLSLKQLGLDLPIIATVIPKGHAPAPPPPQWQKEFVTATLPEPLKGPGQIKIKVNRPMLEWLYEANRKETMTIEMYGKQSPEGQAAHIELKRLRRFRRAMSCFFLLKALYEDGFNRALMGDTAAKLKVSKNTLNSRLKILMEAKLIYEQHNVIKCYSHQRARAQLGIAPTAQENLFIRLIPNLKTFDYVIDAKFEDQRHLLIKYCTTKKIRQIPEIAEGLAIVCGHHGIRTTPSTVNRQNIQDAQVISFTNPGIRINEAWLQVLYSYNVNEHPNYNHLSQLMGYTSIRGLAYRKRKWIKLGIADIYHRQYADPSCELRQKDIKYAGHVHYSRPHKSTMLHFVDKIKLKI